MNALTIRGLEKRFDRPAVRGLDLSLHAGEFYALLGPNGAGKTTSLRMTAGLLRPDAGAIAIFGIDALKAPVEAKRVTAWVPDEPMIYDKLTPLEYLEFVAGLWQVAPTTARRNAATLIDLLGLGPHARARCEGFSKGMRQKVALAGALVHDPRLIILDEPLTGLDAGASRLVKDVLLERVRGGATVLMTTHILEVAERMAERIGIIAHGRLIAEGTLADLRARANPMGGNPAASLEDIFLDLVADRAGGMIAPASLGWFARHEMRLAWRDGLAMLRGGRRGKAWWAGVAVLVFTIVMHLVAYDMLASSMEQLRHPDKAFFFALTGSAVLAWTLLLSQAMETVTRGFYARADLDLILSSPAAAARLFAVRIGAIAVTSVVMSVLLVGPVINVLAALGGPGFLLAYGALIAMGATASAVAVGVTIFLFRLVGPKRTRLIAQIIAAIVGAGFVIGVQAAAILSAGTLSRLAMFQSPRWIAAAPALDSPLYWPARAAMGDAAALAFVLIGAAVMLGVTIAVAAPLFARDATTVAGLAHGVIALSDRAITFRARAPRQTLRWKELTLLRRDPWLVSQSLMQVLYLLPPALLLWRDFDTTGSHLVMLVPVLVMAAGQLAGGLAWLAISGEDAPDLVATAPLPSRAVLRAKIEAVMMAVAMPIAPLAIGMALVAPMAAIATIVGGAFAAAGACAVQFFFKAQAKRSMFRRRQTSSRFATFAEAFLSISIAAAAGLVAGGLWLFALVPAGIAVGVLIAARAIAGPEQ